MRIPLERRGAGLRTKPGATCKISIRITVPKTGGSYIENFKMYDKGGKAVFPSQKPLYALVDVKE